MLPFLKIPLKDALSYPSRKEIATPIPFSPVPFSCRQRPSPPRAISYRDPKVGHISDIGDYELSVNNY
jgi:hypothetical protein